jgi:hypothetical protein
LLAQAIDEVRDDTIRTQRLDVNLDNITDLVSNRTGSLAKRIGAQQIIVEEDGLENHSIAHIQLMLCEDSSGVTLGFQGKSENVRSKVHGGEVSNTEKHVR